jgi:hypothetical protein
MIEIKEYPWQRMPRTNWNDTIAKKTCSYCGKLEYAEYAKRYKFDGITTILCEGCRKRRIIKKLIKMQGQYIHRDKYNELEAQYVYTLEENRILKRKIELLEDFIHNKSR